MKLAQWHILFVPHKEIRLNILNIMTIKDSNFNQLAVLIAAFFFIANSSILFGQEKEVIKRNQIWLQYYNETKINENWILLSDGGYRWKEGFDESSQYIIRIAIGYAINSDVRISSGFAHLGFYSSGKVSKVEFRPYQEIAFKNKYHNIILNHRYRIEERFFNTVVNGKIQTPNTFNFRFRYALMAAIRLFKLSSANPECLFLLSFGDEVFINTRNNNTYNIFDQNRIIISPTFNLNKELSLSLTYSSQFASNSTQDSYTHTNIFWVQLKHKLDFNLKKT